VDSASTLLHPPSYPIPASLNTSSVNFATLIGGIELTHRINLKISNRRQKDAQHMNVFGHFLHHSKGKYGMAGCSEFNFFKAGRKWLSTPRNCVDAGESTEFFRVIALLKIGIDYGI
jgi:hypothetical protein